MAYANLVTFLSRVKTANRQFRLKASSLRPLITDLNGNPTLASLRPLYAAIPAGKKTKYDSALSLLRADFPGVDTAAAAAAAAPVGGVRVMPAVAPVRAAPAVDINSIDYNIHAPAAADAFGLSQRVIIGPAGAYAHVTTDGYTIIDDPWGTALITAGAVPDFTAVNIGRMNEAFRRVRDGVAKSVNTLATVQSTIPATHPYRRFFGAYDAARLATVKRNYQKMRLVLEGERGASKGSLFVVDARNFNNAFRDVFAFTLRGMFDNDGYVAVWVGRAFFRDVGSGVAFYNRSSDETLGTLVHELSHACFGSVDVPPPGSGWSLRADGVPVDASGAPGDEHRIAPQVSDEAGDIALAAASPGDAIRNADNYGQFTRAVLAQTGA